MQLISDQEYAKEVEVHSNYLNWIFGLSTIFISISCLQFQSPWRAAVVGLVAVMPMYFYAFASLPVSLKVLRKLYSETKEQELKVRIEQLEKKFHGWRVIFTNAILWLGLILYGFTIFSFNWPSALEWIKN